MRKDNVIEFKKPDPFVDDPITEVLRTGARKLLAEALEVEIEDYISQYKDLRDNQNRRTVVRNGYLPEREIQTGIGNISVKVPRQEHATGSRTWTYSIYIFLAAPLSAKNEKHGRTDTMALFKRYIHQ